MYLYRHRVNGLEVASAWPIDSSKYELIDNDHPEPPDPENVDISGLPIVHIGGGYYDVEGPSGVITRVHKKSAALAEYRRGAG